MFGDSIRPGKPEDAPVLVCILSHSRRIVPGERLRRAVTTPARPSGLQNLSHPPIRKNCQQSGGRSHTTPRAGNIASTLATHWGLGASSIDGAMLDKGGPCTKMPALSGSPRKLSSR